jgi:hypothetical protein
MLKLERRDCLASLAGLAGLTQPGRIMRRTLRTRNFVFGAYDHNFSQRSLWCMDQFLPVKSVKSYQWYVHVTCMQHKTLRHGPHISLPSLSLSQCDKNTCMYDLERRGPSLCSKFSIPFQLLVAFMALHSCLSRSHVPRMFMQHTHFLLWRLQSIYFVSRLFFE